MTGYVKQGGNWHIFDPSVKVGGTWYGVDLGYIKVGGVWRLWYGFEDIEMKDAMVHRWATINTPFIDIQVLSQDKTGVLKPQYSYLASRSTTANELIEYDSSVAGTVHASVNIGTNFRTAFSLGSYLVVDKYAAGGSSITKVDSAKTVTSTSLTPPSTGQTIRGVVAGRDADTMLVAWWKYGDAFVTMALYNSSFTQVRTKNITMSGGPETVRIVNENGWLLLETYDNDTTRTYAYATKADLLQSTVYAIGNSYANTFSGAPYWSASPLGIGYNFLPTTNTLIRQDVPANTAGVTLTGSFPSNFTVTGITVVNDNLIAMGGWNVNGGVYHPEVIKVDVTMSSPTVGTYTVRRPYENDANWTKFGHTSIGPRAGRPLLLHDGNLAVGVTNYPKTPALDFIKKINGK